MDVASVAGDDGDPEEEVVPNKINQNTKRLRDALWTACGGFQQIRRGDLPLARPLALSSNGSTLSLESGSVGFINVLSWNSQCVIFLVLPVVKDIVLYTTCDDGGGVFRFDADSCLQYWLYA